MRLSHFFIERPAFAVVIAVLITLIGAIAYPGLPVAQYPQIVPPTITVTTSYPGASAELIADAVAGPIESQINGGMIQGLGMALYEGRVMDARLGVMLNPGFGDYKLPGSLEMPEMVPIIDDEDTREAVIGIGEPSAIPACGAVANAVHNACGVRVRDLPITPDKILNLLTV